MFGIKSKAHKQALSKLTIAEYELKAAKESNEVLKSINASNQLVINKLLREKEEILRSVHDTTEELLKGIEEAKKAIKEAMQLHESTLESSPQSSSSTGSK